jgi:NADP-dependent 3-hydroxy acid dehydrogenase YdfG
MANSPVTLITGGSSGIGAATARQLLSQGHRVSVTGRTESTLNALVKELGEPDDLRTFTGDASDHDTVQAAVDATVGEWGRLDNVVANAGYATHDDVADGDAKMWRDMVLTNVLGPALLIKAAMPALKAAQGRIVLIGSVAGLIYSPGNIYGATKWAVTGLAENTRRLVTGDGVGVTLIAPGRVDTNFWEGVGGAPEGNNLTPEQIADTIVWVINQPSIVDVNTVVIRPKGQSL